MEKCESDPTKDAICNSTYQEKINYLCISFLFNQYFTTVVYEDISAFVKYSLQNYDVH